MWHRQSPEDIVQRQAYFAGRDSGIFFCLCWTSCFALSASNFLHNATVVWRLFVLYFFYWRSCPKYDAQANKIVPPQNMHTGFSIHWLMSPLQFSSNGALFWGGVSTNRFVYALFPLLLDVWTLCCQRLNICTIVAKSLQSSIRIIRLSRRKWIRPKIVLNCHFR